MKALQNNALITVPSNADAFVNVGYYNWKKTLGPRKQTGFLMHEKSDIHRKAVTKYIVAPSQAMGDIIEMHSTLYASEQQHNRKMLLKVISKIR